MERIATPKLPNVSTKIRGIVFSARNIYYGSEYEKYQHYISLFIPISGKRVLWQAVRTQIDAAHLSMPSWSALFAKIDKGNLQAQKYTP